MRDQRDYRVIAWERERVMLAELVRFTKNRETFDSEIRLQKAGLREIRSPQREYPKALLDVCSSRTAMFRSSRMSRRDIGRG